MQDTPLIPVKEFTYTPFKGHNKIIPQSIERFFLAHSNRRRKETT